jgi:putative long chain acyl-CoA synthase
MFAYQAAAYARGKHVASLVTFGSPVDMWRNLPGVHEDLTGRVLEVAGSALSKPLEQLPGLPGMLTSRGFKVLNARKEVRQVADLLGLLHDRDALLKREPKRRFLGGEGFVSWPGPALRDLIDQVVVNNRMASGGMVIAGRAVTLADIEAPILCFVGERDDLVSPPAVRAIRKAAPKAKVCEVMVPAGHFGLVVGSTALSEVWPRVAAWIAWVAGEAVEPDFAGRDKSKVGPGRAAPSKDENRVGALYEVTSELLDGLWGRVGRFSKEFGHTLDTMRWQLPRLAKIESLTDETRTSVSLMLAEQARSIPNDPFFVWEGRVFSYGDADRRVNQVLGGLLEAGVAPGDHVGVWMGNRPDYLTAVVALNRLGAVAVLFNAGARGLSMSQALQAAPVVAMVVDLPHVEPAHALLEGSPVKLLRLGRTGADQAVLPPGAIDLEARLEHVSPEALGRVELDPGKGAGLALLMFTSGTTGLPKAARISNRRWVTAALGTAAACQMTPSDTVYCCLPLHHATGMLVAVSGALAGGARLALAPQFSASGFWDDVRRCGASLVFYVGELCRYLLANEPRSDDGRHPVRMFVGNGLRRDVWEEFLLRFGPLKVMEFYGSTEGNVALVNLSGEKVGSVGRPLANAEDIALLRYDGATGAFLRDEAGRYLLCAPQEAGMLVAKIRRNHPLAWFEGYTDPRGTEEKVVRDVFKAGDAWFVTGDVMLRDEDGDYWFVDRVGDTFRWKGENVSTEQVAQVLQQVPGVKMAAVYGVGLPGREGKAGMAALEVDSARGFDPKALFEAAQRSLSPAARPRFVRVVERLELTDSFKLKKATLQAQGADPREVADPLYWYDEAAQTYQPLDEARWEVLSR